MIDFSAMSFEDIGNHITRGNPDAMAFLAMVVRAFHVWDDLIDRDKSVSDADINRAFFTAFVGMHTNPFYRAHAGHLFPIIANSITNWMAATEMERNPTHVPLDHEIAFIVRSEYINLLLETARLCGGHEWAREVSVQLRRFAHMEGFEQYMNNLRQETEARDAAHH